MPGRDSTAEAASRASVSSAAGEEGSVSESFRARASWDLRGVVAITCAFFPVLKIFLSCNEEQERTYNTRSKAAKAPLDSCILSFFVIVSVI